MSAPKKGDEEREQEYMSKIKDLMNTHKVGGAKSTKIMKLIGKQRFRKPGHFVNKWDLLFFATQLNLPDLVEKMMGLGGADINKQFGQRKYTCLHLAASYGYRPIIQLLLQNNAEYDLKNSHKKTAVQISVDDLTRKFLRKEIEKKKNLYSKFRRLESDFVNLDEERKALEKEREEMGSKIKGYSDEIEKFKTVIKGKDKEIERLEDYIHRLKERGLQDEHMLEEYEQNILTSSSVLEDGEKLEIGLQMMKKMVSRNKKLQGTLRSSYQEVQQKQDTIVELGRETRKLKEKITIMDGKYCKEIRKKDFIIMKLRKKLEEISQKNDEEIEKRQKFETRNKLFAKSHKESITVIADLERGLKNANALVRKKEEKIEKLYEIINGLNLKTDGVQMDFKRLQEEVKRHEKDDILGRSPQKIQIFKQKRKIKNLSGKMEDIEAEKKLAKTKLKKLEQVLETKQAQISGLLKKVDEKTIVGTKKTVGLRRELEQKNKQIEKLLLDNQKLELEKKRLTREHETERNRHDLLLKKEKRINLRWEKMLLKMDKEKKVFDREKAREEEKSQMTFEQRRMKRRRKRINEIGTDKGKKQKHALAREKKNDEKNQRSVQHIRLKVSRVFDENEELKHLIKQKEDFAEKMQIKLEESETNAAFAKQKAEKEIEALKTSVKEKELKIEKLNIKMDRDHKRKRMREAREKRAELKKEADIVDGMLYKGRKVTAEFGSPKKKRGRRRVRKRF